LLQQLAPVVAARRRPGTPDAPSPLLKSEWSPEPRGALTSASIAELKERLDRAAELRRLRHAATSPELNCWDVLGLDHDEIQHSRVLAWLLDRHGSHSQGSLFLRELLVSIQGAVPLSSECATEKYRVSTEVRNARSRIDIEIIGHTFLLHVEVKIDASEGEDQTIREREDLKEMARRSAISSERAWGLYLTRLGRTCADTERFRSIRWSDVARAVGNALQKIREMHPGNVYLQWVLDGYTAKIRTF